MERYTVFSLKLANKLVDSGFELIGSSINTKDSKYKVFYFKKTPELIAAVAKYQAAREQK